MQVVIKHRYTDVVLFGCDEPDDVQSSGMATRYALEKAVKDGANMTGAYLDGANLDGAHLRGAYLRGAYLGGAYLGGANMTGANLTGANLDGANMTCANLRGANLRGANMTGANLGGANLRGANMTCANLRGANLRGANLGGAHLRGAYLRGAYLGGGEKLIGERPVFVIGPIGSRCDYFAAYLTDKGIRLRAGCFFGDIDTFRSELESAHGDNDHAAEYRSALALIEKHVEIWTPKEAA